MAIELYIEQPIKIQDNYYPANYKMISTDKYRTKIVPQLQYNHTELYRKRKKENHATIISKLIHKTNNDPQMHRSYTKQR